MHCDWPSLAVLPSGSPASEVLGKLNRAEEEIAERTAQKLGDPSDFRPVRPATALADPGGPFKSHSPADYRRILRAATIAGWRNSEPRCVRAIAEKKVKASFLEKRVGFGRFGQDLPLGFSPSPGKVKAGGQNFSPRAREPLQKSFLPCLHLSDLARIS